MPSLQNETSGLLSLQPPFTLRPWVPALLIATAALGACGGGGDPAPTSPVPEASSTISESTAPVASVVVSPLPAPTSSTSTTTAAETTTKTRTAPTTTPTIPTTTTTPAPATTAATTTPTPPPTTTGRWIPQVSDTWQWQLSGTVSTSVDAKVYDIDLYDTPAATISALKAAGRRVVCYFSAGTSENWRSDYSRFAAADKGSSVSGWAGENWLDTRSANVREIMKSRLDLAVSRGCDGVEPDNVDGYTNKPGFPLTSATQLDYNRFLATEARSRGLAVALKNTVDLLTQLEPYFDFAVNEQCNEYNECGGYSVFTSKGKPVLNAEYASKWKTDATARASLCAANRAANIRTLVLPLALDGSFRYSCD